MGVDGMGKKWLEDCFVVGEKCRGQVTKQWEDEVR